MGLVCFGLWLAVSGIAYSHCDTLDGPVVRSAKIALEKGDVTPALKWVKREYEGEVGEAFRKTLAVRTKSPEARELADIYFFETLVRLHRAGEGAPYTGLKPAGTGVGPAIVAADEAIDSGSVDGLLERVTKAVASGIRERFKNVMEGKKHQNDSVEAGREFVEAYTEFVHYVEGLHNAVEGHIPQHGETGAAGVKISIDRR